MQGRSGHRRPGYTAVIEGEAKGLMSPSASWPVKPPCLLLARNRLGAMSALQPLSGGKRTHCGHVATAVFDPKATSVFWIRVCHGSASPLVLAPLCRRRAEFAPEGPVESDLGFVADRMGDLGDCAAPLAQLQLGGLQAPIDRVANRWHSHERSEPVDERCA